MNFGVHVLVMIAMINGHLTIGTYPFATRWDCNDALWYLNEAYPGKLVGAYCALQSQTL